MYTLKENGGIPLSLLWMLAIIAGISVANLYYNQPLLNLISANLGATDFQANLIATISQAGYACGLLFIIPLGDMLSRKHIVMVSFAVLVAVLLIIATAQSIQVVWAASAVLGLCSVMPQIFIPIASQFSAPEYKSRNVGIVLSGLLTGILASRVVSGIVGEVWGWRAIYYIGSVLMLLAFFIIARLLPPIASNYRGSYAGLMASVWKLYRKYPAMRISSLRAGLAFGSFLCMWSSLAFKMSEAPFHAGNDIVGLLGLCGIAGALTASGIGKYIRRVGVRRFNYIGVTLHLLAWALLFLGANHYLPIVVGIVVIDIGMQCIQLSNQSLCLGLDPHASNRSNTIFMTTYFVGGTTGTFLSGLGWGAAGWTGVVAVGISLTLLSGIVTLVQKN